MGGPHANAIHSCVVRVSRGGNFRTHIPSGYVGIFAPVWPYAAPISDEGRSSIWSAPDYRSVFLGRRLGGCVRVDPAQFERKVSVVGEWIWIGNCGGFSWPFYRPAHQGIADGRRLGAYGVCALTSDQRVLGTRRGPAFALDNETSSIETGLRLLERPRISVGYSKFSGTTFNGATPLAVRSLARRQITTGPLILDALLDRLWPRCL